MKKILVFSIFIVFYAAFAAAEVNNMTCAEFKQKVMDYTQYTKEKGWEYKGKKPCVIDFYTTWCGPCKRLAPIMDELSNTYKGKVSFYKVDTEQERELAYFFQISSIPQVLFIPVKGEPILIKGLYPKEELINIIDVRLLGKNAK